MIINLSVSNIPTEPSGKPNPLLTVAEAILNKATLTKAMWLLIVFDIVGLVGIIGLKMAGIGYSDIGLTTSDTRATFWIVVIMNAVLVSAYGLGDIIINFIHGRGFKD